MTPDEDDRPRLLGAQQLTAEPRGRLDRADVPTQDPIGALTDLVPLPPPGARRTSPWFWRYGFPAIIVACTFLIPLLAYVGRKTVFQSTEGRLLTEVKDPTQPGYRALTEPTPTFLVVGTDERGVTNWLTVLSLTGDGAGGVVFVPFTTVLKLNDLGEIPLNVASDTGGVEAVEKGVEGIIGAGIGGVAIISPQQWADLVAPVGTITFDNPDAVTVPDAGNTERVVFPKGAITLAPADVGTYLSTTNPGESDLNRLVRHEAFWRAWLQKVGSSKDKTVLPGETASGVGKFVRALAESRVEYYPLPVKGVSIPNTRSVVYLPLVEDTKVMMARLVPFPLAAVPGSRPRLRVLDGTGKLDLGLKVAPLLVAAGGQIDQIGNADRFGAPRTQIVYNNDVWKDAATAMRSALGFGDVVKGSDQSGAVDIQVTIGQDESRSPPRSLPAVSAVKASTTTTIVGVGGG